MSSSVRRWIFFIILALIVGVTVYIGMSIPEIQATVDQMGASATSTWNEVSSSVVEGEQAVNTEVGSTNTGDANDNS